MKRKKIGIFNIRFVKFCFFGGLNILTRRPDRMTFRKMSAIFG